MQPYQDMYGSTSRPLAASPESMSVSSSIGARDYRETKPNRDVVDISGSSSSTASTLEPLGRWLRGYLHRHLHRRIERSVHRVMLYAGYALRFG